MAGEAVLSAFMQVLFEKLYTAASEELRSLRGVSKELDGISSTLTIIQALLEDAEEKQLTEKPVRIWLSKLKNVAYDMDELLDSYQAQRLKHEIERTSPTQRSKKMVKVSGFFSPSFLHKGLINYKAAYKIKAIHKKLDMFAREREILGLQILGSATRLEVVEQPQTSSLVDESNVFGREEDREKIITMLLSAKYNSMTTNFSVLPIVGMGGLGKTNLTQRVYNDSRVKEYFELRMWICVSSNFDEIKLTKEALQSVVSGNLSTIGTGYLSASGYPSAASGPVSAAPNMNLLQEELRDGLKGKKFLLVLDDVWNENPQKWERFCISLRGARLGSRIIVTTQNANVGTTMGALPPYHLDRLSDDDCWNLFRNCAFVDGNSSGHSNLEEIGKEIVKKLKGLPLAAKALGSLLYSKLDEEDWRNILRSEIWELPKDKNNILPALRLSYKHLPPHLKQCFTFCSVFHKDYVFQKEKLVQIWMALGYIQPQGRRRLEDIGNSYFDNLLSRSFFQPYKGNYVMHDAIHDLAQYISTGENLIMEGNMKKIQGNPEARHLSYSCKSSGTTSLETFSGFTRLRSLQLLRGSMSYTPKIPDSLFLQLKCLRVLDLYRRDITELPYSIGSLIQLRYLSLSGTGIQILPSSISKLYNLQTLRLKHCNLLDEIPNGVLNLINLRHLQTSTRLVSKLAHIGRLTQLQELEEFIIREDRGFSIRELKNMVELRGQLCIQHLQYVQSQDEANEANLSSKEYISALQLIWTDDEGHRNLQTKHQHEEVLEGLKPHTQLKELTVKGYGGSKFPSWMWCPSYSCLQTIHLSNCRQSITLPTLGQLPYLRYLDIGEHGATYIGQEFSGNGKFKGFPSLKELVIADMQDLEHWLLEEDDHLFPCLNDFEITECPKLTELAVLPPTLTRCRISEVGLIVLPNIHIHSTLLSLQIHDCGNLRSLKQGLLGKELRALEELSITNCEELVELPTESFRLLVKLRRLHISNCPNLGVEENSGQRHLPGSLQDLQISSCSNLIVPFLTDLQTMNSLTNLKISSCSGFSGFPEKQLPSSLKSLGVINCEDLQTLPSDLRFSILETLTIRNCPKIAKLPDKGLPSTLGEFYIQACPLMKESRQNSHIWKYIGPNTVLKVDGERIFSYSQFRDHFL